MQTSFAETEVDGGMRIRPVCGEETCKISFLTFFVATMMLRRFVYQSLIKTSPKNSFLKRTNLYLATAGSPLMHKCCTFSSIKDQKVIDNDSNNTTTKPVSQNQAPQLNRFWKKVDLQELDKG